MVSWGPFHQLMSWEHFHQCHLAREASRILPASIPAGGLREEKGTPLSAFSTICFALDCLLCEQTGASLHFTSAGSITVISKDTNVSDKSHWKENSFRLTAN